MIDEKKLIEDLKQYAHLSAGDSVDTIKVIIKIVEEQPKVGEWIPCSERLPEEPIFEKGYIVQSEYTKEPFPAYWDGENWTDVYGEEIEVIAWQPLPKPFQPKGE